MASRVFTIMSLELFRQLLDNYLLDALTEQERVRLHDMLASPLYRDELLHIMESEWTTGIYTGADDREKFERIYHQLMDKRERRASPRRLVPIFRWAAAAILLVAAGLTVFTLVKPHPAKSVLSPQITVNDIAPGHNGAILTLSGGTRLVLDSAANGQVATQGSTTVVKQNGQLSYRNGTRETAMLFNTLSTPRGRQFQLTLPDGTLVWLNAASSIRYPIAFTGPERHVEIEGEAYFDVAKDKTKPFTITIHKGPELTVLGTQFNIDAYPDEAAVRTTLVNGAVKISGGVSNKPVLLQPGQEANLDTHGDWQLTDHADLDQALAWKNGQFSFHGADIHAVMRQIARWYDIDLSFEKISSETFYVKMSRNTPISAVLKILETTGGVHFAIDGKKITVLP